MHLIIKHLFKSFDHFTALNDINLEVGSDEFVCLLGPSGCGKTTLLRIIAGLLPFDSGSLSLGGRDLAQVQARERGFGIVFQSYSLFPNMTVAENIGYGLKIRKWPKAEAEAKVKELMELIRLPELAHRYPHQLSGGQQQRVAIARALAVEPAVLLLDEPLSALDARVRAEMRFEIRDVQRRLGIPTIMVTHDQEEALTMADRIVCMNQGVIEQIGTPMELYARPKTRFVADFVGTSNLLDPGWVRARLPSLSAAIPQDEQQYQLSLRPEELNVVRDAEGEGRVRAITFLGNISRVLIDWQGQELIAESHRFPSLAEGDPVALQVAPEAGAWVRI